ncbi:ATP-binding protein [Lactobacillus mulieris]|uniref:ATP-binding protein n=1 Tax=Lactobacillus mulieris TaxID=2508708 RepID=UPI001432BB4E|nr:ATP-binding protein [Lactobacillus mulieris]MCF1783380.1 ATP-binding protein [Lactobacillus mulieris]MCW8104088.1 ATP-binding protein [Lactobacillus mulieris]MDK6804025.1 ATP-binding protein [Lactobacillus mulieris]MDK8383157.1 ATP-binding protein [Lactobacillus mulieris]MDT9621363.1 ATP-binding protein [Lactobacillus mulieris]
MEPILRPLYLKKIEPMIDTEFIKVITGVRRSGKSYLLLMIRDQLLKRGISDKQIIYLNFENPEYFDLLDYRKLYDYLKKKVDKSKKNYFFFDEIQEVHQWQKLINGLRVAFESDIYITGSNASLLSGELASYLTGRYVQIPVLPLTFKEYLKFKNFERDDPARHFNDYLEYGGFPSVVLQDNNQLKRDVLSGIYNSILLRDVAGRATIKNTEILERVGLFLLGNSGQLISINKIANTLRSSGFKISNNTIENYLNLLQDAFLFYKVPRYDIRGKELLKGQGKFYAVDLGFVRSQLRRERINRGSKIENLVYLELLSRGYEIFVGKYDTKEIDFVAKNDKETLYIQVTDQIPQNNTRETDNFLHLPTGYRKSIITNNWNDVGIIDGIEVIHITDFLTK